MNELDEIREDLAAFADDEADVITESSGRILLTRQGRDVDCVARVSPAGEVTIEVDDQRLPYRKFLTHYLAHLDVFASRLLEMRPDLPLFIDGPATLEAVASGRRSEGAVALIDAECNEISPFAARVVFITADAGHGKTALLRHFQARQAQKFLDGKTSSLVWHLDLQGRQLLRLSEALMGDVTDLRVPGLWMPAVIRLMRHRAIILAIDGFDELSAEQGTTHALSALALLVSQLEGRGVIVAASRRAFFDTDAYLQRSRMFRQVTADACEFDQLSLLPWGQKEAMSYLSEVEEGGKRIADPEATYAELVAHLHGDPQHVMLTRPFLLSHIAQGLLRYGVGPAEFIEAPSDQMSGVAAVVRAFVEREVSDKLRFRDTGEPFLSVAQHMSFLAAVAEEMYVAQSDRLALDIVETMAAALLDDWKIDVSRRAQVMGMVRMHVLLTPPEGGAQSRHFDHPEFREYFLAVALRDSLRAAAAGRDLSALARLLSVAQLSDASAGYVAALLDLNRALVAALVAQLAEIVRRERRPTFVQMNCGTLVPFLLSGHEFEEPVVVDAPLVFTSVVFEHARLNNIVLRGCTLLNASFVGTVLRDVRFEGCDMGEPAFGIGAGASYERVVFADCQVGGLRVVRDGEEEREYAPTRIRAGLGRLGIEVAEAGQSTSVEPEPGYAASTLYRSTQRLLRCFQRSTLVNEGILESRCHSDVATLVSQVIPLMESHGILERRTWQGRGRAQGVWALKYRLEDVIAAEDGSEVEGLAAFWASVKSG